MEKDTNSSDDYSLEHISLQDNPCQFTQKISRPSRPRIRRTVARKSGVRKNEAKILKRSRSDIKKERNINKRRSQRIIGKNSQNESHQKSKTQGIKEKSKSPQVIELMPTKEFVVSDVDLTARKSPSNCSFYDCDEGDSYPKVTRSMVQKMVDSDPIPSTSSTTPSEVIDMHLKKHFHGDPNWTLSSDSSSGRSSETNVANVSDSD